MHIGIRPAPPRIPPDDLSDDAGEEARDDRAAGADDEPPETTIDDQPHLGVLPNWEPHYGFEEQTLRLNSTTPENQMLMYALQPCSAATALFDRRWIEAAKDATLTLDTSTRRMFPAGRVIIGVDPAFSSGPRSSWFVAVVVLFVPQTKTAPERRIVLAMKRFRGLPSVEAQGDILRELHHDWQAEWLAIESNAAQTYLASYAEHTLHLPVKRLFTAERDADAIPALAHEFASQRWTIPWGDARTQRGLAPLINELVEYPAGTKDSLMAMTFARRVYYEAPAKKTGAGMNVASVTW